MDSLATAEKSGSAFLAKLGAASIADARKLSAEDILKNSPPGLGGSWPIFRWLRAAGRSIQAV